MKLRGRAVLPLFLLTLIFVVACYVFGLTGPTSVTNGQSATYDVAFTSNSSGANGTAYVFMDVPSSWVVTNATYNATVNGSATSGSATTGVNYTSTPCVAVPAPAAGYQRVGFSQTFPTVTTSDTGTLHVTFTVGGPNATYTLRAFGGGTFGGPTQQCNSQSTSTLDVTVGAPSTAPPTAAKSFTPASIAPGGTSHLTVTLTNPNASAITSVSFVDVYPAGLTTAAVPNLTNTCGAAVVSNAISFAVSGGTIPASGSCAIGIDVTAAAANIYTNTIPAGGITSSAGSNTSAASASLTVTSAAASPAVPTLSEYALMLLAALLGFVALRQFGVR
jgi:uncharacterized repeat protein (TIGR01451 family)